MSNIQEIPTGLDKGSYGRYKDRLNIRRNDNI